MRISGGTLAGKQLLVHFPASVKPTTELAREALFALPQVSTRLEGARVLDLFSGSGIVSLEFLSRGCQVHSVDADRGNIQHYKKLLKEWQLEGWSFAASAVQPYLKSCPPASFDIIFADPPYDMPGLQSLPSLCLPLLKPGGLLIIEHRPELLFPNPKPTESRLYGRSGFGFWG
jgi:16S rRNA (guanine(966)-N(2))-methyltransferase RsmD